MTQFPRLPENIRPIADEFVEAWAKRVADGGQIYLDEVRKPIWRPSPPDKKRIAAGARQLYEVTGGRKGFMLWAVPRHLENFPDCRYIASPWSLRYLWPEFEGKEKRTDPQRYRISE